MESASTLYPFLPSGSDFALSLDFFRALGFVVVWNNDGYAGLRYGGAYFILQDVTVDAGQDGPMVVCEVPDLEAYWRMIEALNLESLFPGVRLKAPTDYPWGREIHLIDLGRVCWHIRQTGS